MATRKKATKRKTATRKPAAKTKSTKAKKTKRSMMNEFLVVQSKFKEALKAHDLNVAGDAAEGANKMLFWSIEQAAKRAKANGRKTVRAHDFVVS